MMDNFSVINRNYGHWDICNEHGRIYKIRGGPGSYYVFDCINKCKIKESFNTVNACMNYICDKLMYELIITENQKPYIIEQWNIS